MNDTARGVAAPMIDASDDLALERRLDAVHESVLNLQRRVAALEGAPVREVATPPPPSTLPAPSPGTTLVAPIVTPTRPRGDEGTPVLPLALAGGGALLLGLAFFAWHAMEQQWIGAGTRLAMGAIASVGLTAAAWPLARRGHIAVAGAVGGAGLGAWFSAWLVARHAHELVSGSQALAALVAGAIACLLLADRMRLRLMAGLATAAACATPALIATGADRLAELMVYQLGLLAVLAYLDKRRTWPELPTMGLLGTWALTLGWAASHLGPGNADAFVACGGVLMLTTGASCWRLALSVSNDEHEQIHVAARLGLSGVVAWAACAWAWTPGSMAFATGTMALALWHGGLALLLVRRQQHSVARVVTWLAWIQAAVVPWIALDGASAALAWSAMAGGAALATWLGSERTGPRLIVLPTVCAVVWAALHGGAAWAMPAGLVAATIPLAAGLVPGRGSQPIGVLVGLGTAAWVAVAAVAAPQQLALQLSWGVVPVLAVAVRALLRPDPRSSNLATVHSLLALVATIAVLAEARAFDAGLLSLPMLAIVLMLAGVGAAVVLRTPAEQRDLGGIVVAGFVGVALAIMAPRLVPAFVDAGRTAAIALTGLGLVVAGLRLARPSWRQLGLGAIAVAAAKVVVLDTAGATLGARALSFIGIGAVLILGAFAYSRAQRRASASMAGEATACTW